MDAHISNICRSTYFHIRNIGAIRDLLTPSAAAQLVHSLVTSRVDYCNALLLGVPDYKIKRLQRMHNIAARTVARPPHNHDIDEVLQSLHWLPVKSRILFKTLLLVYKCENGLASEYLSSLLVPYVQERYGFRSNDLDLLSVPSADLKSYGHRAFSFGAVVEWNKLPLDLRQSPSVAVLNPGWRPTYLRSVMPDYKLCLLFPHLFLLYYGCVDCVYFCPHTYILYCGLILCYVII